MERRLRRAARQRHRRLDRLEDAIVWRAAVQADRLAWTDAGLEPPPDWEVARDRQALVVLGRPGAGKSSRLANPWARRTRSAVVDADDIKPLVGGHHEVSSRLARRVVNLKLETGDNLVLPKIGADPDSIVALARRLERAGYAVDLVLVEAPAAEARRRTYQRAGEEGRAVPPDQTPAFGAIVRRHRFRRTATVGQPGRE